MVSLNIHFTDFEEYRTLKALLIPLGFKEGKIKRHNFYEAVRFTMVDPEDDRED